MTALDKTIPGIALKLLTKFGKQVILTINLTSTYDPNTGSVAKTTASQTVAGSIEEYADNLRFLGDSIKEGDSVIDGDKKVTIAAKGLTNNPKPGDRISIDSQNYNIMGVGSMWSGELVAAYVLHCRKA